MMASVVVLVGGHDENQRQVYFPQTTMRSYIRWKVWATKLWVTSMKVDSTFKKK